MGVGSALAYLTLMGGAAAVPVFATVAGIITPFLGAVLLMVVALALLFTVEPTQA